MEKKEASPETGSSELRRRAEEKLGQEIVELSALSEEDKARFVHELRVHQIELEMQNDELRKTQLELEQVKDEYYDLYNFAPVGYLVLNKTGLIVNANLASVTMLGVEKSLLKNQRFSNYIDRESQDTFYLHRRQVIETRTPQTCELQLVRKDKTRFWAQLECKGVFNDQGELIQLKANLIDITERKQAETSIKKLSNAVEQSPSTVVITDLSGAIEYVNPKFEQLTGYKPEEVLGKNPNILQSGEHSNEFYKNLWNTITAGKEWHGEFHNKKKNGDLYWESATIAPIADSGGRIINYLAVKKDITEQRLAEDQLKASLKEKETLLQEIHHRVKNNMQVISSLLKLQAMGSKDKKTQEALNESQSRVYAMSALHEALYGSENLSEIDSKKYLSTITNALLQTYHVSPLKVSFNIESESICLKMKMASPLGLIINELISNSLKHAFPGDKTGAISIVFKKQENKDVILSVMDNGVGISNDLDWRTSEALGLRLIRDLVEKQLGGSIELDRSSGTKFTIKFNPNRT